MKELRYSYRPDDDRGRLLAAVRDAGYDAQDEVGVDGVQALVVTDVDDRERLRDLLQSARQSDGRPSSLLFEDELAGGG